MKADVMIEAAVKTVLDKVALGYTKRDLALLPASLEREQLFAGMTLSEIASEIKEARKQER